MNYCFLHILIYNIYVCIHMCGCIYMHRWVNMYVCVCGGHRVMLFVFPNRSPPSLLRHGFSLGPRSHCFRSSPYLACSQDPLPPDHMLGSQADSHTWHSGGCWGSRLLIVWQVLYTHRAMALACYFYFFKMKTFSYNIFWIPIPPLQP